MKHLVSVFLALTIMETAHAGEVQVAVAANFAGPMEKLAAQFQRDTGHKAIVATGATGKFYAQIRNGAPFEVLLAADDETPARLETGGHVVAGSRFTYAVGRLVLWSARDNVVDAGGNVLKTGSYKHLAIANPKTAPYGAAAVATLQRLGLYEAVQPRIVRGENIAQAWQFASTGNAELGFVAQAQVWRDGKFTSGSGWIVPANMHEPIRQDAALLARGAKNPAARALLQYLRTDKAKALIRTFGYEA
jgi:molybdate transport system substrate-binding protein